MPTSIHLPNGTVARLCVLVAILAGVFTVLGGADPAGASSTLYVATNGTDGSNTCTSKAHPCLTLQHAYNEAKGGNTIDIGPGTFAGDFGVPVMDARSIEKDLTLIGTGSYGSLDANTTTVSGEGGEAAIINSAPKLTIEDLVVDGATVVAIGNEGLDLVTLIDVNVGPTGTSPLTSAGVANSGTIVMDGGSITNSDTSGFGGFLNGSGAKATLHDVTLTHNSATSLFGEGGGILNNGTVTLTGDTAIHNNSASVEGGGIFECPGSTTIIGPSVSITGNSPNNVSSADPGPEC